MSDDLRERQPAYQDWLLRERQRAALDGAACGKCVFWRETKADDGEGGVCHNTAQSFPVPPRKESGWEMDADREPGLTNYEWWCEHYLPRAEHDRRPAGGAP